jgi:succinyl-diaminopimelate desuccinylase
MKGGIAVAAAALAMASDLNKHVGLLLTADEEVGSLGAPDAADGFAGLDVGAVIIPKATDNKIVLGHRGACGCASVQKVSRLTAALRTGASMPR